MKTRGLKTILVLATVCLPTLASHSQIVRVEFSSRVTSVTGSPLQSVHVGSVITGWAEVDLARLPRDGDPWRSVGSYAYSTRSGGLPGFTMELNAGVERVTYDSINAANDPGHAPGIFMYDDAGAHDWLLFQARDQGKAFAAVLSLEDITRPWQLLTGDYFPESINLRAGLDRARLDYFDSFGGNALIAEVTSVSVTLQPGGSPAAILAMRVRTSNLSEGRKQFLLHILETSDVALARGRCRASLQKLRVFQQLVRAQVTKSDPELAHRLISGAQAIINGGCSSEK